MRHPLKVGLSFGLTSGIITTLGLMVGLGASTHSKLAVLGGILTIAIADSFSDALGIHLSEESENVHSTLEVWQATISTFVFKLIFASVFIIPVLVFDISLAIKVSVVVGLAILGFFSYKIAREEKENCFKVISEHVIVGVIVIFLANYVGKAISELFSK